jgi:hypothetical protein
MSKKRLSDSTSSCGYFNQSRCHKSVITVMITTTTTNNNNYNNNTGNNKNITNNHKK